MVARTAILSGCDRVGYKGRIKSPIVVSAVDDNSPARLTAQGRPPPSGTGERPKGFKAQPTSDVIDEIFS